MIEERRKLLLILHSECSYRIEKCAHTIFVRKSVKNCIFLDEWLGVRISIIQAYMVDYRCIEKGIGNF